MKIIISILLLISVSCKENKSMEIEQPATISRLSNKEDTVIRQQIWYYNNQYVLQTYVQSKEWTTHFSAHREPFDSSLQNSRSYGYAPYNVDIIGGFEYIKHNKAIEYKKAVAFLDSIRPLGIKIRHKITEEKIKEMAIADSVELLKAF